MATVQDPKTQDSKTQDAGPPAAAAPDYEAVKARQRLAWQTGD